MKKYQLAQIEKISHILSHIGDLINDINMEVATLIKEVESEKRKDK